MTPDVWVDFNDITSTGETTTFLDYAAPDVVLAPGHTVWAGDGEGKLLPRPRPLDQRGWRSPARSPARHLHHPHRPCRRLAGRIVDQPTALTSRSPA